MKKVTLLLLAALLVAPAMAVVEIEAIDNLDGTVTIGYECTEGELPRGIALAIARTDGDAEAVSADVDADYNTFIDWAYSNPTGYEVNHPDQHPFADPLGPGVATLPAADFSLCMGVLDQSEGQAAGPGTLANLVTITFAGTGVSTFSLDVDTLRGGVVGSQLEVDILTPTFTATIGGEPHCMAGPGFETQYAAYQAYLLAGHSEASLECWCAPYQCYGDIDGLDETFFKYQVYGNDIASLVANWKKKIDDLTLDPCADIDHLDETFFKYRVYGNDIAILVANWKKKAADLDALGQCPLAD